MILMIVHLSRSEFERSGPPAIQQGRELDGENDVIICSIISINNYNFPLIIYWSDYLITIY